MSQSLFLFLLLASSAFMAFSQNRVNCDPDNRPNREDCFGPDATFEPTCAYYSRNCPFDVCGRDVSNPCDACSDPNVRYYRSRQCEPELVVTECMEGICDTEFDPQASVVFEPVCGFRRGCSDDSDSDSDNECSRTFNNVCAACANSNYPWYQSGVCQDDRRSCRHRRRLNPTSNREVCAFFDTEDGGVNQRATIRNAHTACSDDAVNFYTRGECAGPNRDNTTYCLPNVRPEFCTLEYNPVCGFFLTEDQGMDHKILGNPCSACNDSSIIYHQPGPCVFTCNRNPGIIFECDGVTVDPVCGSYQDSDGETRQISLKNGCIGCYNIPILIDNYTDGLCPGDIGIRCENDAGGFLIGRIFPVCGYFEEDCDDSSCRQTYSESVAACSDENVVLYAPGLCPGDEGVPCTNFRTRPDSNSTGFMDNVVYSDVCGYREQGCNDSSCRETFDDQYDACEDDSVQFFTNGPCA